MHIFTSLSQLLRLLQQFLVSKSASFCIEMRKKRHSGERSKQRVFDKKGFIPKGNPYYCSQISLGKMHFQKPKIVNWINELQVG